MYALLKTHSITTLGLWVNQPAAISVLDFDPRNPEHVSQLKLELKRYSGQLTRVKTARRYETLTQAFAPMEVFILHKDVYNCIKPWCSEDTWIPLGWENKQWPYLFGALLVKDYRYNQTFPRWALNRPDDFLWPADWKSDFVAERYPSAGSLWLPDAAVAALNEQLDPALLATIAFCPLTFAETGQLAQLKRGVAQTSERSQYWFA